MQGSARDVRTNSKEIVINGPIHIDTSVMADDQLLTYISTLQTLGAVKRTSQERWSTGVNGKSQRTKNYQHELMDIICSNISF